MSTPHPVDIHVGRRLRLKRTFLGLSQESVGKQIGVTFQQIQKYERGINRMGASRLYDFAKALGVQVSYFFEGFGDYTMEDGAPVIAAAEPNAAAFEHETINNRETLEVMRAYYRIRNPAVRKRIVELIKAMAAEDKAA
ncbi:MAG: helix-turn-helix transcriptional regulator [Alphaproteobacteria bacterium]|nr:helix-turn-helix transcriptional regulator [Alphaproteobacteria bacterium]